MAHFNKKVQKKEKKLFLLLNLIIIIDQYIVILKLTTKWILLNINLLYLLHIDGQNTQTFIPLDNTFFSYFL